MIKNKKEIIIAVSLAIILIIAFLTRISGYLFMEIFQEAKYVAAAIGMTNIFDIFSPHLNGVDFFEPLPFYYLLLHISGLIFAGFTEFSVRTISVLFFISAFFITFALIRRMTNKKFALITTLTTFSTALMILFSTVSSPYMLSSCFSICAILSAITTLFTNNQKHKQWYFFWFWGALTLSVLTAGLRELILPLLIVIPVMVFSKKKEFFALSNLLPGLVIFLTSITASILLTCKINDNNFFVYLSNLFQNSFNISFSPKHYLCYIKKSIIVFILGLQPFFFSFLAMLFSYLNKFLKFIIHRQSFNSENITNEEKVSIFSFWGLIVSCIIFALYTNDCIASLIPVVFFAGMSVAHYWYKYTVLNRHNLSVNFSSLIFYLVILIVTIVSVIVYFFFSQLQKTYVESLIPPLITVTLLVSIPGIIALVLKRRVMNYCVHILSSILFYFFLTGLLFNYINSFGENDLVNFSIKAQKDGARLVTFDITNKYSMDYYFKSQVVFNGKMSAEEIYNNYGNTTEVYLVLKLEDLAYFDKFFVYEIIATGKQYCEITNIKYLPKDEVKLNPEIIP